MPLPISAGIETKPYTKGYKKHKSPTPAVPSSNYNQRARAAAFSQPMLYKTNTYDSIASRVGSSKARVVLPKPFIRATPSLIQPTSTSAAPAAVGQGSPLQQQMNFLRGLRDVMLPIRGSSPTDLQGDFGPRINPYTHRSSFHTGADISSPLGTPIFAPANGYIEQMNEGDSIYGHQIVMDHGKRKETMYGHMTGFAPGLKIGSKIKQGDVIGFVGSEGYSTGPHLHWETWVNGNPVNPLTFLGGS